MNDSNPHWRWLVGNDSSGPIQEIGVATNV